MGNCCASNDNDATNSWSSDALNGGPQRRAHEERRVVKPNYSSSDDGKRFANRAKYSSSDYQEEAKQYDLLDDETRAAFIMVVKFKRANGCPGFRFADLV